jgi:hypothetical protein
MFRPWLPWGFQAAMLFGDVVPETEPRPPPLIQLFLQVHT